MNKTLDYYDKNANQFAGNTQTVDFSEIQNKFLNLLPDHALILDLGCGSGGDSFAFLQKGYRVEARDGSKALCEIAQNLLKRPVRQELFEQLEDLDAFDGIWACASLLHVSKSQLPSLFSRIEKALKTGGIFYCSFKKGTFEGERNGRYFTNLTEETLIRLMPAKLQCLKCWESVDVRPDREEVWINALFRKESV